MGEDWEPGWGSDWGASWGSGSEAGSNRPAESRLDSWSAVASLLTSGLDAGSWHASLGLEAAFGSPPGLEVGSLAWAVSGARVGVSVVSGVPRMSGPGCRASGSSGTLAGTWTGPVPASEWPGPSPWVWGPSSIPFISETSELLAAILRWERAEGLCGDRREDGAVETAADPGRGDRLGVRRKAVSTAAPGLCSLLRASCGLPLWRGRKVGVSFTLLPSGGTPLGRSALFKVCLENPGKINPFVNRTLAWSLPAPPRSSLSGPSRCCSASEPSCADTLPL